MTPDPPLRPIEIESDAQIRDRVRKSLREAILRGDLRGGERLIERRLAEQLGVSRTPVREALRLLEQEGLVSHLPRIGAVVTQLDDAEVYEVYRIREVLEGLAARMAAERIDAGGLARLEEILHSLDEAAAVGDLDALEEAHAGFNDAVYRAAGSPRLYAMLNSLAGCIARGAGRGWRSRPGRLAEAAREHRRLVEAIRLRDGDLAERAAREHVINSRLAYFKRMADREQS